MWAENFFLGFEKSGFNNYPEEVTLRLPVRARTVIPLFSRGFAIFRVT
jgi:hypothetical protein